MKVFLMKKVKYGGLLKIRKIKIKYYKEIQKKKIKNKSNKIENNTETDNIQVNKENKSIDDEKFDIKSSKKNQMLEKKIAQKKKKLKDDLINNNDQIQNKSKNNKNLKKIILIKLVVFYVQVASLSKKDLVEKEWNRFKKKHSKYMTNLIYISQKAELKDNRVFFRLLVGKFMSKKEANNFCDKLSISKCIVKKNNE